MRIVMLLAACGLVNAKTFDCNVGISRLNISSPGPFPSSVLALPLNHSFVFYKKVSVGLTYTYYRFNDPSYSYYDNFKFTGHEVGACFKTFFAREQIKGEWEAGYAVSLIKGGMDFFCYTPVEHIEPIRMDDTYQTGSTSVSALYYLYGFYVGTYVTCKLLFRLTPSLYAGERLVFWGLGFKVNRQFKLFL